MAVILWAMGLSLLAQCSLCSDEQHGCLKWRLDGADVCCEACRPGHRLVKECGSLPKDLCVPCEPKRFTTNPKTYKCDRCTQCVGALVLVKECTSTTDTQCGCKEGLMCGGTDCSFCVKKCDKGQEPTENRSCRPCPEGTFNDQIHQKCKPLSTKCPNPDVQVIVSRGNAFSDIKCANVSVPEPVIDPTPDETEQAWPLVVSVATSVFLMAFTIITIVVVAVKINQKRKTPKKPNTETLIIKTPIIRTPTDDPATLIAIECSFHEAQQEQGSSSESLNSKDSTDSTDQLIG